MIDKADTDMDHILSPCTPGDQLNTRDHHKVEVMEARLHQEAMEAMLHQEAMVDSLHMVLHHQTMVASPLTVDNLAAQGMAMVVTVVVEEAAQVLVQPTLPLSPLMAPTVQQCPLQAMGEYNIQHTNDHRDRRFRRQELPEHRLVVTVTYHSSFRPMNDTRGMWPSDFIVSATSRHVLVNLSMCLGQQSNTSNANSTFRS